MGRLFDTIRALVAAERYVVGLHAIERLAERGLLEWQIVDGIAAGTLIVERPSGSPNPVVEVRQLLPDGTEVKAVWAHMITDDVAKLVTVHFLDTPLIEVMP